MTVKRPLAVTLLAWLAMLGWDFLLHGGLLASFYVADDPVLLSPLEAFQRIPLGYAGFFLLALLLVWLAPRFALTDGRAAAAFGLKLGALIWGAFILGLVSIVRFDPVLGLVWFAGQTVELGIGAVVVQQAASASRLRSISWQVVGFMVVCIAITVVLQSLGFAPALTIPRPIDWSSPMKLVALYDHPEDPEAFDQAYFGTHVPLVQKVPGLQKAVITRLRASMRGADYYLLAELYFEDEASFKAGMNSPEMAAAGENLDSFAKGQYSLLFGVEEEPK